MLKFEIPDFLKHLPVQRGYPVPFFAAWVQDKATGEKKADLRVLDSKKHELCLDKKLCAICGKKLPVPGGYLISGPVGLENRVSSDTFMHYKCALFSMQACPHIALQKLERRENYPDGTKDSEFLLHEKPPYFCLIKADKYELIKEQGQVLINYRPVSYQKYVYINGAITLEDLSPIIIPTSLTWRKGLAKLNRK